MSIEAATGAQGHDRTCATDMEGSPVLNTSTASWAPVVFLSVRPAGGSMKVKVAVHLRRPLTASANTRDVPSATRPFGFEAPAAGERRRQLHHNAISVTSADDAPSMVRGER